MHYNADEIARLVRDLEYLSIAQHPAAQRFVTRLLRDARELEPILLKYPEVRYEALDYHYVLLKYLAAFNTELAADLCLGDFSWRGVVAASWLTCLKPEAGNRAALASLVETVPRYNRWFVELAISEIDGATWTTDSRLQQDIRELRRLLGCLPPPRFELKRSPAKEQLLALAAQQEQLRQAYLAGDFRHPEK